MLPYKSNKCRLTSGYGYRTHPVTGVKNSWHGGIDLVGIGTSSGANNIIRAVHDGTVVRSRIVTDKSDATWQWGEYVAVTGTDGVTIYYCHLAKRLAYTGQTIKAGDLIGYEGSTGQVTGQHLHFECRRGTQQINAADYLGIANAVGTYADVSAKDASTAPQKPVPTPQVSTPVKGGKVKIKPGAKYKGGSAVPTAYIGRVYTVGRISGVYALINELYSWVPVSDLVTA